MPFGKEYGMNQNRILALKKSLNITMQDLGAVQEELACGMLDLLTAEAKVEILRKDILQKKKLLIAEVHVGKRGNPLSMGKYNVTKGLYIAKCSDGKQVTSVSEEGLLDAMMVHYNLSLDSPKIKDIFMRAIERYERKHPDSNLTIKNYHTDYRRFINSDFSNTDIRRISRDKLEDYVLDYVRKYHIKVSTLRNFKTLLNLIYEQAILDGFITENIAKSIKPKSLYQYCDQSLAHRRAQDVLFTEKELALIFDDMQDRLERYYCPFAFMVLLHVELGCRPDELICLKWSDLDCIEGKEVVWISRQQLEKRNPQSFYIVEYTKNEKGVSKGGRIVPLSTKAKEILEKLQTQKKKLGIESEWLFSNKEGILLKKKGYFDFFNALKKKHSLNLSSYAFRREFNFRLEKAGVPVSYRAAVSGHSPETNLKNYTFAGHDLLDVVSNALN